MLISAPWMKYFSIPLSQRSQSFTICWGLLQLNKNNSLDPYETISSGVCIGAWFSNDFLCMYKYVYLILLSLFLLLFYSYKTLYFHFYNTTRGEIYIYVHMNISLAGEFCCYILYQHIVVGFIIRTTKKRLSGVDDCIREEFIHMYVCAWMFICTSQKEGYNKFVYLFVVVVCVVTVFRST